MNSGTANSPVLHSETDKNSNENWLVQFDSFPTDDPYNDDKRGPDLRKSQNFGSKSCFGKDTKFC